MKYANSYLFRNFELEKRENKNTHILIYGLADERSGELLMQKDLVATQRCYSCPIKY